jgi:hypothetical protein
MANTITWNRSTFGQQQNQKRSLSSWQDFFLPSEHEVKGQWLLPWMGVKSWSDDSDNKKEHYWAVHEKPQAHSTQVQNQVVKHKLHEVEALEWIQDEPKGLQSMLPSLHSFIIRVYHFSLCFFNISFRVMRTFGMLFRGDVKSWVLPSSLVILLANSLYSSE